MRTEIEAYLTLRGPKLTASLVTAHLGVAPDKTRMPPGHGSDSRRPVKVPWSAYASGLGKERELSEHVRALLDTFHPLADRIRALREQHGLSAMIDASVESYGGDTPPFVLEADLVSRMADLGASFWIDLYLFDEDEGTREAEGESDGLPAVE